jgi:hypothetical protein
MAFETIPPYPVINANRVSDLTTRSPEISTAYYALATYSSIHSQGEEFDEEGEPHRKMVVQLPLRHMK